MQVILTQEVLGLGDPGDVVTVKDGYGRNYLIPKGIALQATKKNLARVEAERTRILKRQTSEAEMIRRDAGALDGLSVTVEARAGEGGKLYGSVTNMDIAKSLAAVGHEVDRRRILMAGPIKSLGQENIKIKLHPQVVVEIRVSVEPLGGVIEGQSQEPAEDASPDAAGETAEEAGAADASAENASEAVPAEDSAQESSKE